MIRAIKFLLVFAMTFAVVSGFYYASIDRFDIVACLLILINSFAVFIMEIWHLDRRRYERTNFPLHSTSELEEMYDAGYIEGLQEFLQSVRQNNYYVGTLISDINNLPKIKECGCFSIDDNNQVVFNSTS